MDTYRPGQQKSLTLTGQQSGRQTGQQTEPRALVLIHGGGMVKGGKGTPRPVSVARDMAEIGFDVFVPSYTLGTNSWPQNLEDVSLAVQFVKNVRGPYTSVVLMGLSAGATLALLCGILRPRLVSAVVSMYGITSPADRTYTDTPTSTDKFRPGHIHQVVGSPRCVSCRSKDIKNHRDARCTDNKKNAHCIADVWIDISPVEQLRKSQVQVTGVAGDSSSALTLLPRFVLVHGDKDRIVNPNQAQLFSDAHKESVTRGNTSTVSVIRVPNGQHGFDLRMNRDGTLLDAEPDLRSSIVNALFS